MHGTYFCALSRGKRSYNALLRAIYSNGRYAAAVEASPGHYTPRGRFEKYYTPASARGCDGKANIGHVKDSGNVEKYIGSMVCVTC